METSDVKKTAAPAAKKTNSSSLRVRIETRKRVLAELSKINKKTFGRKVRVDQLLNLLLGLITPEHVQKLQDGSLTNADRLEMKFREHVKKVGQVSKDEFLGFLLSQEAKV